MASFSPSGDVTATLAALIPSVPLAVTEVAVSKVRRPRIFAFRRNESMMLSLLFIGLESLGQVVGLLKIGGLSDSRERRER